MLCAVGISHPSGRIAAGTVVGLTRFPAIEKTSRRGASCATASSSNQRKQRSQRVTQTHWIRLERFPDFCEIANEKCLPAARPIAHAIAQKAKNTGKSALRPMLACRSFPPGSFSAMRLAGSPCLAVVGTRICERNHTRSSESWAMRWRHGWAVADWPRPGCGSQQLRRTSH